MKASILLIGLIALIVLLSGCTASVTNPDGDSEIIDMEDPYASDKCTEDCSAQTCENCLSSHFKCGKKAIVADSQCQECTKDSDCKEGYKCEQDNWTCTEDTRSECETDADCSDGYCENCKGNQMVCKCAFRVRVGSHTEQSGCYCAECAEDSDCKEGYECDRSWGCVNKEELLENKPSCTEGGQCEAECANCEDGQESCMFTIINSNDIMKCVDCFMDMQCKEGYECYKYDCVPSN